MNYNVNNENERIIIGEVGENLAESCTIDYSAWVEEYGEGDLRIRAIREGDAEPYPVANVETADGVATWTYTAADTAVKGFGEVQVLYYVGDVLAKSRVWKTYTYRSLSTSSEEVPDPYADWLNAVERIGGQVEADAEAASVSADSASASATLAAGSASEAAESALSASRSASAAMGSASAASTSAESAASSATAASRSATEASNYEYYSERYMNEAKSAKFGAESARTGAENAKAAAQASATAAAQSAAQAEEAAESIEASAGLIQKLMDNQIKDTATGTIATYPDGADMPMVSLVADIEPIQDLHGYDRPWVGDGGKNKLDDSTVSSLNNVTYQNGVATEIEADSRNSVLFVLQAYNNGTYVRNLGTSYGNIKQLPFTKDSTFNQINFGNSGSTKDAKLRFDVSNLSDGEYKWCFTSENYTTHPFSWKDMMIVESSVTDYSYEPYSNICPISGWDSVDVSVAGKNLLNPLTGYTGIGYNKASGTDATLTEDSTGITIDGNELSIVISASWGGRVIKTAPLKAGDYRVNIETTNSNQRTSVYAIGTDGNTRGSAYNLSGIGTVTTYKTLYDGESIAIWLGSSVAQTIKVLNPQIEIGTTSTSYEPYQGQTYHTTLPQTVYGGTLDVVSGVLTVDRAMVTLNGQTTGIRFTEVSQTTTADGQKYVAYIAMASHNIKNNNIAICDAYAFIDKTPQNMHMGEFDGRGSYFRFVIADQSINTLALWNAHLAENPMTLVYELATPQTIQLTPTQIDSLLGRNNVLADSGDVTVEYIADTKLYIQKVIS